MAKNCPDCGAPNSETAKFCNECGFNLSKVSSNIETKKVSIVNKLNLKMETLASQYQPTKADILFVLDCTGSMQGEIDAIRDAIVKVVETIEEEDIDTRVGLLAFRDRLIREEHFVLKFDGEIFTQDAQKFRAEVSKLKAKGGGDRPESSLDALLYATRQPFGEEAKKIIVLITDAPPNIPDKEVEDISEVQAAFQQANIHQFYLVIPTQDKDCRVYFQLYQGRKGLAFEIGKGDDIRSRAEDFKHTLVNLGKTISQATR